jgi:hypothetical protein
MRTYHKDYGVTASITDNIDGSARLIVRGPNGKKIKDSVHKSRNAALAAWRRLCK